jgi:hypothetical protein
MKLLEKREPQEKLVVGRTGSLTLVDWNALLAAVKGSKGLLKFQVGKTPADLYVIWKDELLSAARKWENSENGRAGEFLSWLFDGYLFHRFERIHDIGGVPLLLRNSYEYHRENIHIAGAQVSNRYADLYRRLDPDSLAGTTITAGGEVVSSVLGGGVKVEGAVRGSVVFSGVTIGKHSEVYDSVILPSNVIEDGVVLNNALVLEGNRRVIGRGSIIGGDREAYNPVYRDILKHGLTVIGEGLDIPSDSRIGAGCLVTGASEGPIDAIELDDGGVLDVGAGSAF